MFLLIAGRSRLAARRYLLTIALFLTTTTWMFSCKPDFGIELKIDTQGLTGDEKAAAKTGTLIVTGDEPFTRPGIDVAKAIHSSKMHLHYTPHIHQGRLILTFDLLDAQSQLLASGRSAPVEVIAGTVVPAFIRLSNSGIGSNGNPDMGKGAPPADLGPPKPQGSKCGWDEECATPGGCVDGYCCDTPCGDTCKACNVPGKFGICSSLPAGTSPAAGHGTCGPDAETTCGRDGTCDGEGACRKWGAGTICQPGSCDAATDQVVQPSTCDGQGTCKPGTASTCEPYRCKDSTSCWPSCDKNEQCWNGNSCVNGSCGLKPIGADCSASSDCKPGSDGAGHCVDKVCCDTGCTGTCQFCALASSRGTCTTTPAGLDPRNQCPTGSGSANTCSPGGCSGTGASCKRAPSGTACGSACSGNNLTTINCDANGMCTVSGSSQSCGAYACETNGSQAMCINHCASDRDCNQPNFTCSTKTGQCAPALGQRCTGSAQCASGYCSPEGICCDSACNGKCQTCSAQPGHCTNIHDSMPSSRCGGSGVCAGFCNGTSGDCYFPSGTCNSCTNDGVSDYAVSGTCQQGSCVQGDKTSCDSFACDQSTGACFSSCTSNDQCNPYDCVVGQSKRKCHVCMAPDCVTRY